MGNCHLTGRGLVRRGEGELAALRDEHDALDDFRQTAAHALGRAQTVAHVAGSNHDEGDAFGAVRRTDRGDDLGCHRLVAARLGLEHRPQFRGIDRHVHRELELHQAFVGRVVEVDVGRQLRAIPGREFRQAAAAAHRADHGGGRIQRADRKAMRAGEFAERLVVAVIPPLLFPFDLRGQRREGDLAAGITVDRGLVPRLELLKAKRQRPPEREQFLQQSQLELMVTADGVRLARVDHVGLGEVGDDVGVVRLLSAREVDPALRRSRGCGREPDRRAAGEKQDGSQHEAGFPRPRGGRVAGCHWERNPLGRVEGKAPKGSLRGVTVTSVVSFRGAGPPRSYSISTK